MANNYTQFSAELQLDNEDQCEWFHYLLNLNDHIDDYVVENEVEYDDEEDAKNDFIDQVNSTYGIKLCAEDIDDAYPNFQYKLQKDSLWVYAEEDGNINMIGKMVQAFFNTFRPDGIFYLTYADTCSKMRIDEFGGGAMVVTAKKIDYFSTNDFVNEKLKEHKEKLK